MGRASPELRRTAWATAPSAAVAMTEIVPRDTSSIPARGCRTPLPARMARNELEHALRVRTGPKQPGVGADHDSHGIHRERTQQRHASGVSGQHHLAGAVGCPGEPARPAWPGERSIDDSQGRRRWRRVGAPSRKQCRDGTTQSSYGLEIRCSRRPRPRQPACLGREPRIQCRWCVEQVDVGSCFPHACIDEIECDGLADERKPRHGRHASILMLDYISTRRRSTEGAPVWVTRGRGSS